MLEQTFSRANFEGATDLQTLCADLARELTRRLRAAKNVSMEVDWIVADLRAIGHDVSRWDEVISDAWEHPERDRYLWIWLDEV